MTLYNYDCVYDRGAFITRYLRISAHSLYMHTTTSYYINAETPITAGCMESLTAP